MQKLTLDLDAIAVESFDAQAAPRDERGTVEAFSGQRCSAVDACPTGRGCTVISPC